MAKRLISFNFNTDGPTELNRLKPEYPITTVDSKYRDTKAEILRTDMLLAEEIAQYYGKINTHHLCVAEYDNGYVCELSKAGKPTQICIASRDGNRFNLFAGEIEDTGLLCSYGPGHKGSVFLMALFPFLIEEAEADSYCRTIEGSNIGDSVFSQAMCGISNNLYYRYKSETNFPALADPEKITQKMIDTVKVKDIFCGKPKIFSRDISPVKRKVKKEKTENPEKIRNKYQYDPSWILTPEEEKRVPEFGKWFVVPEIANEIAQKIQLAKRFRTPINTILLYGPSGTGKTEMCKAIAAELGLPYYSICPGTDADKIDLTDAFVPNTEDDNEDINTKCKRLGIPTYEDVEFNYEAAFEQLFGRKPDKLDKPADAYKAISERLLCGSNTGKDFLHVETELVKCFRDGGLCEIQEADVIKRASVLTILNPILNGMGKNDFIQLANGEILRRNKNCVVIFTTNHNYEGCNNLQQSIYSRISLKREIKLPTAETLYSRCKADTGFTEDILLRKMATITVMIHNYLIEKDITSGVCGPRELTDWAIDTILTAEIAGEKINERHAVQAGLETIIEAVAQDPDDREDVITAIFKKQFSVSMVDDIAKNMAMVA